MLKQEFLDKLRASLCGLPKQELDDRIAFYGEVIDDRTEEGLTEEEAVSQIGSVEEVASQIIAEIPLSKLAKERFKPRRHMGALEILLLALGSPIWLSLAISALAVIISLYAVLWSLVVSAWSVFASLTASAFCGLAAGAVFAFTGNSYSGLATVAASIFCAGLSIFAFFGCKAVTKGIIKITKKLALGIKKCFVRKERVQ